MTPALSSFERQGNAGVAASSLVSISYTAAASAGVLSVSFDYQTRIGSDFEVVDAEPGNSGQVASGRLSPYAPAGAYFLVSASVTDSAGNRTTYARDGTVAVSPQSLSLPQGTSPDLSAGDFTLTNPGEDVTSPELVQVGVTSPAVVAPGAAMTLSYAVTENNSGLATVQLTYTSDLGQTFVLNDPSPTATGVLHTVAASLPPRLHPGRFRLTDVLLSDYAGNQSEVLSNGSVLRTPEGLDGPTSTSASLPAATFRVAGGELVASSGAWQPVHRRGVTFARTPKIVGIAALVSIRCLAQCGPVKVGGQTLILARGVPQNVFTTLSRGRITVTGRGAVQGQLRAWVQPGGHDAASSGALQAIKPRPLHPHGRGFYTTGLTSRTVLLSVATTCVKPVKGVCRSSVRLDVAVVNHGRVPVAAAAKGNKQTVTLVGQVAGSDQPVEVPSTPQPIGTLLLTSKVGGRLAIGSTGTTLVRIAVVAHAPGQLTLTSSSTSGLLGRQVFLVQAKQQTITALIRVVADGSCGLLWSGPTPASARVSLVALTGANS